MKCEVNRGAGTPPQFAEVKCGLKIAIKVHEARASGLSTRCMKWLKYLLSRSLHLIIVFQFLSLPSAQ